ncbi:cache domain-containing sensor histidine kinase [Piscibacillus halophilus]|uniref:cache domain-containing sensor histidine kinase n=1 Tax=Piscibacillus halophilus TaxID=571933 RepID=UPI0024098956|nr:sensor histidine kinase [Piscibacillus halophilus]
MNKFKSWFINLKLRNKILLICLMASIVPIIALGSIWYYQIQNLLMTRETESLDESLNQAVLNLDYKLNNYFNAINQIAWNDDIKRGLSSNYDNNYEMYKFYLDTLTPHLKTTKSLQSDINAITIYGDNKMNSHGDFFRPLKDIDHKSWFNRILTTTNPIVEVSDENRTFLVLCQIFDRNHSVTNIVQMDINYDYFFHSLTTLFEQDYGLVIVDQNEKPIYTFGDFSNKNRSYQLSTKEFIQKLNNELLEHDFVYKQASLSSNNWTVYLYRPMETVATTTHRFRDTFIIVIFSCILLLFISIFFLARVVVRPLEKLAQNMEQIEKGDLSVTVYNSGTDEIGNLIRQFGNMVVKLKDMINQVYKSKIAQQEYEMKALQAQINPHFFYNSLSLINSKAIIADQEDISQMAQLLSTFYRTTLNKGKSTIYVKDELENTTSYIEIQRMMHSNSFDVKYEFDESMYNYSMLNLLLQPLVENAINHGIDHKEDLGKGSLMITAKQSEYDLIFTVVDNGCGMDKETLRTILTTKTKGYGVRNVHNRVQLFYGSGYGLVFESELNKGTTVTLTIPKVANN